MKPLERACKALGTKKALAAALGIHQSTVSAWAARGRIPAEHVLKIEGASGVSRHELRPDLYPPETNT